MVRIRKATLADIPEIIACSLLCFPQEDPWDDHVYEDFIVLWPRLVYVAQDLGTGCIVGFVVAHMEGEDAEHHGYIANLGVHPTRRKLGIAAKLMTAAENAMVQEEYGCEYVYLNVRESNHWAELQTGFPWLKPPPKLRKNVFSLPISAAPECYVLILSIRPGNKTAHPTILVLPDTMTEF